MADNRALLSLEQRIANIETNGIKLLPATANPGPLGLYGFAMTTILLQGLKTQLVEPGSVGIVNGFGFFFGGLAQFVAGIMEYQRKNAFATCAFCCFGAFWMSIALYNTLAAAGVYAPGSATEEGHQMMLAMWGLLTFFLWLCTFNMNMVLSALFISLAILFWLLAATEGHVTGTKVAGSWGIVVAAIAFYAGTATLMEEQYGRPILPLFPLKAINKLQAGNLGTKHFVAPDLEQAKA